MANPQTENGYLKLANELVEQFQKLHLSGNEWMILWVVWRKTYCWKKKDDAISLTQFGKETGLSRPSTSEAIVKLVGKKVLLVDKNSSVNIYSFNKDYEQWANDSTEKSTTARVVRKSLPPSTEIPTTLVPKKVPEVVPKTLHTKEKKETITKETLPNGNGVITDKRNKDLTNLLEEAKKLDFPFQGTIQENRRSAYNVLKKYGLEIAIKLVNAAVRARGKPYSPTINDFTALYKRAADLVVYWKKQEGERHGIRDFDN